MLPSSFMRTLLIASLFVASDIRSSICHANTIYFSKNDGSTLQLWESNGTAIQIAKTFIHLNSAGEHITNLTPFGDKVVFSATDGVNGYQPWISNGTYAGTTMLANINSGSSSYPTNFTNVNGTLYFIAQGSSLLELWASDGTSAGTKLITSAPVISSFANVNGTLCSEVNLYLYKGVGSSGIPIYNITNGIISNLINVNGTLVFANNGQIWSSLGTSASTVVLISFPAGYSTTIINLLYDSDMLFIETGDSVWAWNVTASTLTLLQNYSPGNNANDTLADFRTVNGTLYFSIITKTAFSNSVSTSLWKSDGTAAGTTIIKSFVSQTGVPLNLTNVNGTIYFGVDDGTHGNQIWRSDGTTAGTVMITDLQPALSSFSVLTNVNGTLFFEASDGTAENLYRLVSGGGVTELAASVDATSGIASTNAATIFNVQNDFNGDGQSDVLWRNTNGDVTIWNSNAGSVAFTSQDFGFVSLDWAIAGTGDFYGYGQSDILWRNGVSGNNAIWDINAQATSYTSESLPYVSTDWLVAKTGDFIGSGVNSILWRNTSGEVTIWNPINNSNAFSSLDLGYVSTDWQIQQVGDFNGVGQDSILWRNTNGYVTVWNASAGTNTFTAANLGYVSSDWTIAGTGDFNAIGQDDILWHNTQSGAVALWEPNANATSFTSVSLGTVSTDWQIQAVGDYNGDGKADILWRNISGEVTIWVSSLASLSFTSELPVFVSMDWQVAAP